MAGEWRASTWGEEISLEYGKALRDYNTEQGEYRVFGSNGPIGWTAKALAPGPGVILGRKGAYRGIEFSREPFFVIDTAYYVVPKGEFDMRWLYYAIKHHKLGEIDDGSPIPSTTRSAVYVRDFDVPPLAEQKAIAAVLGALDEKIELNRRMNATLEAMARALFQSWFIDFDPVRANMDRNQPAPAASRRPLPQGEGRGEGRFALDPATAALFPEHLEDSPLGHIPKGWEVKTADEVSTVGIGRTPPRMEHHWFSENQADVPWMSIRDLGSAGVFISHTAEFLTAEAVEKFRVKRIPDNTVVLSFKLTMGRVAITDGEMLSNEAIAHFRLNPETTFGSAFLYCYLKGFGYDQLGSTSSIATAINSDMVRGMRVLVPPKGIAEAFERMVNPLFTQMKNIQKQSRTLATLRDTLLPKLLSGELRVAEAAA
ncbi:MAG: restriction endonuclease subunit S [Lentisphaerae bacterium]|nr:restriction endonuclease subunit S [Lentisphaerota bacterium]